MENTLPKINLQLFAEDKEKPEEKTQQAEKKDDNIPKTQTELDQLIETRLTRAKTKWLEEQGKSEEQGEQKAPPQKPTPDKSTNDNLAQLEKANTELITARAQLEAFKAGVMPEYVEDVVYLAYREAEKNGDTDDESIKKALAEVLKRHPTWKVESQDKKQKGFRVGASDDTQQSTNNEQISNIFGN